MADTETSNVATMSELSESDKAALVSFKESMNSQRFHIKMEATPDPLDPEFLRFLNFYIFDEKLKSLQPFRDEYETLPESVRNQINATDNNIAEPKPDINAARDKGWTNNNAPDLFFSGQVYSSMMQYHAVSAAVLFADIPTNPNSALLKQIAEKIGIDPNIDQVFSEADVGRIAAEMLTAQAKELCIEETDINNAIHRGDFMPHTNDLFLVERGFGFPDDMKAKIDMVGAENEWKHHYGDQRVSEHQSAGFAARYGSMDDEFVQDKAGLYQNMEEPRRSEFIRSVYESPASYFGVAMWSDPEGNMTPYEVQRENHYLPKLARMMDAGEIGLCNVPTPSTEDDLCTVESMAGESNCSIYAPPKDDICTVESMAGESDCGQSFAEQAASDTSVSDAIATNISDTTGNDAGDCTMEIAAGIDKIPCAATPKR